MKAISENIRSAASSHAVSSASSAPGRRVSAGAVATPPAGASMDGVAALDITDEMLMSAIQDGRQEALGILYDRYSGVLMALIMRVLHNELESEDVLQEVFMELWNRADNFSAAKGKPFGWMVTLTRRRAIDRLRKRQAYARAEERLQKETESQPEAWVDNEIESDIITADVRELLGRVLENLPPAQKQAVEMAYYKGMSQREIAAKTGIPLGTIKTRLELGLKKISEALRPYSEEFVG